MPEENIFNNKALLKLLKIDEQTWDKCGARNSGSLDFVAIKTQEFLLIQNKLKSLDHN